MKTSRPLFAALLLLACAGTRAEETSAPLPSSPATSGTGGNESTSLISSSVADILPALPPTNAAAESAPAETSAPLLPEPLPAASPTAASAAATPPSAPKRGSADRLRQDARIQSLKTELLNTDTEIQAQRTLADNAKTANGRRTALRNFYTLLYTRIGQRDPALKEVMEGKLYVQLRSLEQNRVQPAPLIESIAAIPGSCSADHRPKPGSVIENDTVRQGKNGRLRTPSFVNTNNPDAVEPDEQTSSSMSANTVLRLQ